MSLEVWWVSVGDTNCDVGSFSLLEPTLVIDEAELCQCLLQQAPS